jgi:hypothetical protein
VVGVPAENFSLLHVVHTGFGDHPASYKKGSRGVGVIPLGLEGKGRETDNLPPTSVEVKKTWIYTLHCPIRLHGVVLYFFILFYFFVLMAFHGKFS